MSDKAKRIIRKYYEFLVTKFKILHEQKIFGYENVKVKYMLKEDDEADTLIIVFSACTRKGLKARYNYVKTLDGIPSNRLYILDDYAKDHRGSYYMGENFQFNEEKATDALIKKTIAALKPKKLIFCGSSKGGYAALNFGLQYCGAYMVIGAPQYYLTSYLKDSENFATLEHILGKADKQKEETLEYRLRNKIYNNEKCSSQHIYVHYSNQEHTYQEHVVHMLEDMKKCNYQITNDVASYTNHGDLSYYFPDFLRNTIEKIVESR